MAGATAWGRSGPGSIPGASTMVIPRSMLFPDLLRRVGEDLDAEVVPSEFPTSVLDNTVAVTVIGDVATVVMVAANPRDDRRRDCRTRVLCSTSTT
jgi:hypothetical protein